MKTKIDTTWSPQLAYVVGLITTDGCLSPDGRHILFTSIDLDLIQTFKGILGINNKIGYSRNKTTHAFRIQFGNVVFYNWLKEIGLTPSKSKTLSSLKIPDKYFIDFLRGHLDGDGSITTYTDYHNTIKNPKYIYERLFVRFISASKTHVEWLQEKITHITGIEGRMHKTKPNPKTGSSIYTLKFGKKASKELLSRIYYSPYLPCLERKRIIADQFLPYNLMLSSVITYES